MHICTYIHTYMHENIDAYINTHTYLPDVILLPQIVSRYETFYIPQKQNIYQGNNYRFGTISDIHE